MTLQDRYEQLLKNNEYQKEKNVSKEEMFNFYKEGMKWIDKTKQFKTPDDAKLKKEDLKKINETVKNKFESIHSTYELLGNMVLNEFNNLQRIANDTPFPNVLFRKFPTQGLNAHAIEYPEGYLVIIEKALDSFYQILFAVICRSKAYQLAIFKREVCESLSHDETVEIIGNLFKDYLDSKTISDAVYYNYTFTPNDGVLFEAQGLLYREFIFYIISHELSHIHLNHHSTDAGLKDVLEKSGLYSKFSQSMELSADNLTFKILFRKERVLNPQGDTWSSISSNQPKLDIYLLSFYSAITTYFITSSWIDKIWETRELIISGKEEIIKYDNNTHPSDSLRQLEFMEWIHGVYPNIIHYSYFNSILRDIRDDVILYTAKALS